MSRPGRQVIQGAGGTRATLKGLPKVALVLGEVGSDEVHLLLLEKLGFFEIL